MPSMKYKKNADFEMIRMEIISLLNAYDWQNQVIDNSEQVKTTAITFLKRMVEDAKCHAEAMKQQDLTYNKMESEGYLLR